MEAQHPADDHLQDRNKVLVPIFDVFIRRKDESVWRADLTGADTITPGVTFSIDLTVGFFTVHLEDCYGGDLYQYGRPRHRFRFEVPLRGGRNQGEVLHREQPFR